MNDRNSVEKSLIAGPLLDWYAENGRDLPWRKTRDPYKIWVSEIILQQTRVAQGLAYYRRFMDRFPDVQALAAAPEDEVMKYWQGLGYYSRARNLHAAARTVVGEMGGVFPRDYRGVRSLRGIGDYTAAAICSVAYGLPVAAVDGNVYRVLSRVFDVAIPIDGGAGKRFFAGLAAVQLDPVRPGDYNQAIMDFGALQCVPGRPDCQTCPLTEKCLGRASGRVLSLPVKAAKTAVKPRYFHYFRVRYRGNILLGRREGNDIWRGLYEFPLVETVGPVDREGLPADKRYGDLFAGTDAVVRGKTVMPPHVLSHRVIHACFYDVETERLSPALARYRAVPEDELGERYAMPRLLTAFLEKERKGQ